MRFRACKPFIYLPFQWWQFIRKIPFRSRRIPVVRVCLQWLLRRTACVENLKCKKNWLSVREEIQWKTSSMQQKKKNRKWLRVKWKSSWTINEDSKREGIDSKWRLKPFRHYEFISIVRENTVYCTIDKIFDLTHNFVPSSFVFNMRSDDRIVIFAFLSYPKIKRTKKNCLSMQTVFNNCAYLLSSPFHFTTFNQRNRIFDTFRLSFHCLLISSAKYGIQMYQNRFRESNELA